MGGTGVTGDRSGGTRTETGEFGVKLLQFGEEIQRLMMAAQPPDSGGSTFTALLELPPTQAMELLHSPEPEETLAEISSDYQVEQFYQKPYLQTFNCSSIPKFPVTLTISATAGVRISNGTAVGEESTETMSSMPINSYKVKNEPTDDSNPNSSSPLITNPTAQNDNQKSVKRKNREKKVKGSNKKRKSLGEESSVDAEQLPYVHVRARRGQATDSHSLAERARREKINARMKLLQELVPGCSKISGTALVLDEIINHVQSLQNQVELLSMRIAAVNPRDDFNIENLLSAENGSLMDSSNFPNIFAPMMWPEIQLMENRQQDHQPWQFDAFHQQPVWPKEEDNLIFLTSENSLLSYDSSANSVSLQSNEMKMEI